MCRQHRRRWNGQDAAYGVSDKLLQNEGINVATLSRGYKRKSKGYILATAESSVQKIGDELSDKEQVSGYTGSGR